MTEERKRDNKKNRYHNNKNSTQIQIFKNLFQRNKKKWIKFVNIKKILKHSKNLKIDIKILFKFKSIFINIVLRFV